MLKVRTIQIVAALLLLTSAGSIAYAQRPDRDDWNQGRNGRYQDRDYRDRAYRDRDRGWNDWNRNWAYLGEANVDGRYDHDKIKVSRSEGLFRQIQLRVERGPIEFHRVVVHYRDGRSEEIQVRDFIPAGGQTRAIDLRGGSRAISSVEIWYARAGRRSVEPKVRLYGW